MNFHLGTFGQKLTIFTLAFFAIFNLFSRPILASGSNIFGLHLTQPSDINTAARLINSRGGDWGWATIVIRLDQLDYGTWQDFFNQCRRLHIIPIIRLATINENGTWKRPSLSDLDNLVSFLNSLNWPTKEQHVILFNEVNRADEWGGGVDPKNYADMAIYTADKLKNANPNFVILSAGLDLAAPQTPSQFESAENFYNELIQYKRDFFDHIDALASHSYPNLGFVGTPNDTGPHSITGYLWEISYLKRLGINKNLPVYITETGWPHREGESKDNHFYTIDTSAEFLITALNKWGQDPEIKAVTPFIFNYPYYPFDHFSWVDKNTTLYPAYQKVVDLQKNSNRPEQIFRAESVRINLPLFMFPNHEYGGEIILKNTGQSIWGKGESEFCLTPQSTRNIILDAICTGEDLIEPGQSTAFPFKFKLGESQENSFISWEGLPSFQIKSILPIISNAEIYHQENSFFDRVKRGFYNIIHPSSL